MNNTLKCFCVALLTVMCLVPQSSLATVTPRIAAGNLHTVLLRSDGTVWAWGSNGSGELGDGSYTNRLAPIQVTGLSGVTAIAGGGYYTVALKSDGTVWAWGRNDCGQLGDGTSGANRPTPVKVAGLSGVTAISAGYTHTVALKSDGTVWAWGANNYGQLGIGNTTNKLTPVQVSGLSGVSAIAAGFHHTVALKSDNTVRAWGGNSSGQLGDGSTTTRLTPVQVSGLSGVTAIAAGIHHTVALKNDATVWAWGSNYSGQLGDGSTTTRLTPVQVSGLSGISVIAAGGSHTLALKNDRTVWASGNNDYGQLGDGIGITRLTPVQVSGLTDATAIAGGGSHTAVLKTDGTVWAYGRSLEGQLGNGSITQRLTPVQIAGFSEIIAIGAGVSHTVALKTGGTVWNWGDNLYRQLGIAGINQRLTPLQVPDLAGITAIAAGYVNTVALKSDGTVWNWGNNSNGQLGCGSYFAYASPVQVSGLTAVTAIAGGWYHTVARKNDGTVWAWGRNEYGQLGDGTSGTDRITPVQVSGLTGVAAISAGESYTVALKNDGTVWAWGENYYGKLGDGTSTNNRLTPVQVSGLTGITAIAASVQHTVALKNDGTVWTWGGNYYGQLGDGSTTTRLTPVQVSELTGVTAIASGVSHTVALKNDGTVWAWGYNNYGQLGYGSTTTRLTPVQVTGLTGVTAIASGYYHTVALKNDGTVLAWGYNGYGQLGDPKDANAYPALINPDAIPPIVTANQPGGTYTGSVTVTLSCSDDFSGCSGIRYTEDNSTPTTSSPLYSGPITISATTTLQFMAVDNAGNQSSVQSIAYTILPSTYPLTITFSDTGSGTVSGTTTGTPSTVNYSTNGSNSISVGATVTLTATANNFSSFAGWSGACNGTGTCQLTMDGGKSVGASFSSASWIAAFDPAPFAAVVVNSSASSSVTLRNYGIAELVVTDITISGDGAAAYGLTLGTCGSLTPTIAPGGSCTVNISFNPTTRQLWNATLNITSNDLALPAASVPLTGRGVLVLFDLSLDFSGYGTGSVAFSTGGSCTTNCSQSIGGGTTVTLTPTADAGATFAGWTGCESVNGDVCTVTMSEAKGVAAGFDIDYNGVAPPAMIPRTGQTTSYASGDDGDLQKGVAWPEPRFTNPDGSTPVSGTIVLDKLTGLEWPQDGGTPTFATCTGGQMNWQGALDYVACLNTNNYLGHNDWRLPNVNELASLVDRQQGNISSHLNTQGFNNVQNSRYWSSTTNAGSIMSTWCVSMDIGSVSGNNDKAGDYYAWAVRDVQSGKFVALTPKTGQTTSYATGDDGDIQKGIAWPEPRLTNPDGSTPISGTILLDKLTGLEWPQDGGTPIFATCTGGAMTWQGALDYVACLNSNNYLGHNDWRLPNINELVSLVDRQQGNISLHLNAQGFSNVKANLYWSSSNIVGFPTFAWNVLMQDRGRVDANLKTNSYYIWPVRNGQSGVSGNPVINVSPSTHDFPSTATFSSSSTQEVTIGNSGTGNLIVGDTSLTGTDADQFSLAPGSCPSLTPTITAGSSCTMEVTFTPTTVGAKTATLQITSSDPAAPTTTVTLSGTAYDPAPIGTVNINGGATYTTSTSVTLTLSAFDNSGSVTEMRFSNNNSSWSSWELYNTSKDWTLMALGGDGNKTIYAQFKDAAGNASGSFADSIIMDTTPPVVTLTAKPASSYNSSNGNVSFSASETTTFTCSLNGATAVPCTNPWSFSGLADGSHTLVVTATDSAGLTGNASHSWAIDTTMPTVTFTTTPANPSGQSSGNFTFTSEAGATFQCQLDGGSWYACSSPYTFGPLTDGSHSLSVRANDTTGNVSSLATYSWAIDTSAPPTAKIGENNYATLTAALAAAADGSTLQLLSTMTPEAITYSGSATLTLTGGYDGSWNRQADTLSPVGTVTIVGGTLIFDGVVIQ